MTLTRGWVRPEVRECGGPRPGPPRHLLQGLRGLTGRGSAGSVMAEGGRPGGSCGSELLEGLVFSSSVLQSGVLATGAGGRRLRDPWGLLPDSSATLVIESGFCSSEDPHLDAKDHSPGIPGEEGEGGDHPRLAKPGPLIPGEPLGRGQGSRDDSGSQPS